MRKWYVVGAVVLVAAALVVGTLLMDSRGGDDGDVKSTRSDLPPLAFAAWRSHFQQLLVAAPGQRKPGSPSITRSEAASAAASRAGRTTSTTPEPVREQVALSTIMSPPQHTIAFIDAKRYSADSTYTVTFVPYGKGPSGDTLVIRISESKPGGDVAKPFDFNGQNVLVDMSQMPANSRVVRGGEYTGEIRLVAQRDVLAPYLTSARPLK